MIDTNPLPHERTVEDIAATINGGTMHLLLGTFDAGALTREQQGRASSARAADNLKTLGLWDADNQETDRGRAVREILQAK